MGPRGGSAWRQLGPHQVENPRLIVRGVPFPTGPKVQPYLPELMECMLQPLRNPSTPRAKELAVSALGAIGKEKEAGGRARGSPREPVAGGPGPFQLTLSFPTATAAQASLLPYFPTIMEHLREFLVTGHEDLQPVRIQSLGEKGGPRPGSQCQGQATAHLV